MFDLVVPVYNSMHHVRSCLFSVFRCASRPCRLIVVDDCGDNHTREGLDELLALAPMPATLLRNESNLGYLKSVNRGIAAGDAPIVVLINSDTVMLPGFLERLEADFAADPKAGVINPVSTWANWTRIPFPNGFNIHRLSREAREFSSGALPDIHNASGFFFAVRRALYDQIGLFDEAYGFGYWEEADFCMRALKAGWRVAVDDGLYIFHHGWGSFQEEGRNENMRRNKKVFMDRWGTAFDQLTAWWQREDPVAPLRVHLEEVAARCTSTTGTEDEAVTRELADIRLDAMMDGILSPLPPPAERPVADPPRILYILPAVSLYGGIISVLQVVNQLVLRGFDANVATYGPVDENVFRLFPMFFRPYVYPDKATMVADFPACDLVVATAWETAYSTALLLRLRPGLRAAYFVQDYEPDFYTGARPDLEARAERTYHLVDNQIVKTRWLARLLKPFGKRVRIIPLGLNLDFFHDAGRPRPRQIISLARPSSSRRNFPMLCEVYAELHRLRPELTLAVYGDGYDPAALPFPVRSYGKLSDMAEVAGALNDSMILLDCSTFQGFGRPGLEAMACGTAAVLTHEGGITQYAKHRHNCLLIDPFNRDEIVKKTLSLLDDEDERARLIANGKATAAEYSVPAEGARTEAFFREVLGIGENTAAGG
jgi:GT2 family glycosyltransferase